MSEDKMERIRLAILVELSGVAIIILCAALMARDRGFRLKHLKAE